MIKTGKELNTLIAEKIVGLKIIENEYGTYTMVDANGILINSADEKEWLPYPDYSNEISEAWKVVEHLNLLWFQVGREGMCGVHHDITCYNDHNKRDKIHISIADSKLAYTICIAILKYKGIQYE